MESHAALNVYTKWCNDAKELHIFALLKILSQ